MSTNTEIITDALGLIGVLAEGETPTAEQAAHGLRRLNQMLARWDIDEIRLGYFTQSDTSATCPVPDWAETGVMGKLALELSADYRVPVPPGAVVLADDGYSLILRTLLNQRLQGVDMTHLGAGGGRYDITTDSA